MDVTEETFYVDVIQRSHQVPVVVDFWAEWCSPCRMLAPVLEREVGAREGKVVLAKVNVDQNPTLASHYGVRSIPAVKAFRNGRVVAEFVGVRSAPAVAEFLDSLLGPTASERVLEELRASGEEPEVVALLEAGEYERALERLLQEARGGDAERKERVRRWMVAIFEELGHDHPLAARYRRQLATALY